MATERWTRLTERCETNQCLQWTHQAATPVLAPSVRHPHMLSPRARRLTWRTISAAWRSTSSARRSSTSTLTPSRTTTPSFRWVHPPACLHKWGGYAALTPRPLSTSSGRVRGPAGGRAPQHGPYPVLELPRCQDAGAASEALRGGSADCERQAGRAHRQVQEAGGGGGRGVCGGVPE